MLLEGLVKQPWNRAALMPFQAFSSRVWKCSQAMPRGCFEAPRAVSFWALNMIHRKKNEEHCCSAETIQHRNTLLQRNTLKAYLRWIASPEVLSRRFWEPRQARWGEVRSSPDALPRMLSEALGGSLNGSHREVHDCSRRSPKRHIHCSRNQQPYSSMD